MQIVQDVLESVDAGACRDPLGGLQRAQRDVYPLLHEALWGDGI